MNFPTTSSFGSTSRFDGEFDVDIGRVIFLDDILSRDLILWRDADLPHVEECACGSVDVHCFSGQSRWHQLDR